MFKLKTPALKDSRHWQKYLKHTERKKVYCCKIKRRKKNTQEKFTEGEI